MFALNLIVIFYDYLFETFHNSLIDSDVVAVLHTDNGGKVVVGQHHLRGGLGHSGTCTSHQFKK